MRVAIADGRGDRRLILEGDEDDQPPGEQGGHFDEEFHGERGVIAVAGERVAILVVDDVPEACVDFVAMSGFQPQAGLACGAALAREFLAFVGSEAGEEVVEVAVSPIEPVELHAAPHQEAGRGQSGAIVFFDEQALPRGRAESASGFQGGLDQRRRHGFPFDAMAHQEARPR